jgi:hypothetical protein
MRVIKMACSSPSDGHAHWTLQFLENTVVTAKELSDLSDSTIGSLFKNLT